MGDTAPKTEAHIIAPPRIRIGNRKECSIKNGTFNIRSEIHDNDYVLQDWVIIYSKIGKRNTHDQTLAEDLYYNLKKCGRQLGIKVKEPRYKDFFPRNKKFTVGKVVKNYVRNSRNPPEMVLCLIDTKEQKLYKEIKDYACQKLGVNS